MAAKYVEEDDINESVPRKSLSEDEIIKRLMSTSSVTLRDLVPSGPIKSINALKVGLWILSKNSQKRSQNSISQRIKWLTAAVEYGIVDSLTELQKIFNPLIQLIYISQYQASVCHLLYMLATPDLYKFQIERITKNANVVGLTKPLAGLLSRLKSLRPDLVPQTIPQQSNAVSFPKAPASIRNGFYSLSERLKERNELPRQASFIDEKDKKRATKRMRLDIVPRVQHINLKSSSEVDYRKMVLLSQFQTFDELVKKITKVELPNHIGSLLGKRDHHYVLAVNFTPKIETLLSRWLYITLYHELLEKPQTEGKEGKTLILDRIVEFQQSTGIKLMVVYDFLSEYLRMWDGIQYHPQILQLLSEVPFLPYSDLYEHFLKPLEELYYSSNTRHRIRVLNTCQKLIYNLMLQKFGPSDEARLVFKDSSKSAMRDDITVLVEGIYVVSEVIRFTERLLNTALTSSSDISLVSASLLFYTWLIEVESEYKLPFRTICQPITVYMAFFSPTPMTISLLCQLLCKYSQLGRKQLMSMSPVPEMEEFHRDSLENASLLNRYVTDISNCLVYEKAFTSAGNSFLSKTPKKILKQLLNYGSVKGAFALKRHPAFTGVARMWIKSKASESPQQTNDKYRVFEEIDRDPEDYIRYLFGSFPAIQNYLREFHISREDSGHEKQ